MAVVILPPLPDKNTNSFRNTTNTPSPSGGGVWLGGLVVFLKLLMFLSGRGGRGQTPEGVLRCETAEKIEVQVFDAIALQMDEQRNGTGGEIFFLV